MPALPTKISELNLTTIQPTDQIPIARGSGATGRTYKVLVRDLVGGSFTVLDTPTINLTFDVATITLSAEVIDDSISDLKLRNSTSLSVIGRSTNSLGNPADIAATTNGQVLRVNNAGTVLGFGPVDLANPNSVTNVLPISAGGSGSGDRKNLVPVGAIMPMATPVAPIGWLYCDGSTIPAVGGLFQGQPVVDLQNLRSLLAYTYDPTGTTSFGKLPDLRGMFVRGWDNGRGIDPGRAFATHQIDAFQGHKHGIYDPGHTHLIRASGSFVVTGVPGPGAPIGAGLPGGGFQGAEVVVGVTGGGASPVSVTKQVGTIITDYMIFNGVAIANAVTETTTVKVALSSDSTSTGISTGVPSGAPDYTGIVTQNPISDAAVPGSPIGNSGGTAPRTADETRPENVALYYCIKY